MRQLILDQTILIINCRHVDADAWKFAFITCVLNDQFDRRLIPGLCNY